MVSSTASLIEELDNAITVHKSTMRNIFADLGANLAMDFAPRIRKKVQPALPPRKQVLALPPATLKLPEDAVDWEAPEKKEPALLETPQPKPPIEGEGLKRLTGPFYGRKRKLKKELPK